MQRLVFLAGDWTGEATVHLPSGAVKVQQSEHVEYKLDGLLMVMEGTGRTEAGEVRFRAFATISYDEAGKAYRFRSYNEGRYLDTELKATPQGFEWRYPVGPATVRFRMTLGPKGEWTETGEVVIPDSPPHKTLEMTMRKAAKP